ncbi:MAG: pyridoxal-dependent decarboxylase, partial [Bacteroidota bacterium]
MQTTSTSSIETIYNVDQFRTQGHELIDMLSDYLSKMLKGDEVPVLPNLSPDTLYLHWNQKLKEQQIFHFPSLIQDVLDQSLHLHHPRNAGHQVSSPAPLSV